MLRSVSAGDLRPRCPRFVATRALDSMSRACTSICRGTAFPCVSTPWSADPSMTQVLLTFAAPVFWEDGDHPPVTYRFVVRHFGFEEISSASPSSGCPDDPASRRRTSSTPSYRPSSLPRFCGERFLRPMDGGVKSGSCRTLHTESP